MQRLQSRYESLGSNSAICADSRAVLQPIVLNLYERFYLPLQASLRPATKAFILALLPGLEEETGEFFEKVRFAFLV